MIKAVIFDLDDTLYNTTEVVEDALRSTFVKYLLHFPGKSADDLVLINVKIFEKLMADPNVPLSSAIIRVWFEVFEHLQIKPPLKIILRLTGYIRQEVRKRIQLIDGVLEVMKYLKSKDVKIGVLTNGIFIDQASKLIKLKVDNFVDYLVTSDMCAADKPDSKMFKYLLYKMNVLPNQTLMIGNDLVADINGAYNIGMKTLYFKNGKLRDAGNIPVKQDYTKTNYKDILRLIKELTSNQK